jgi:iron complex outermembrane receptor protein/outer membrane receptor for ferrienterochelin and colicins
MAQGRLAFSEFGFMAEKIFKHFSVFINLENFTDTRQSKYKDVGQRVTSQPNIRRNMDTY